MKKIALIMLSVLISMTLFASVQAQSTPFSDHLGHKWENSVEFVFNHGIVQGYPDGTYQPYKTLNRAELLKVIVVSAYSSSQYDSYEGATCFNDVDGTQWYTKYVCFGKAQGIVEGYPDGTFKPDQQVNFVEALKIILVGMDVPLTSNDESTWYQKFYLTGLDGYLIPDELYNKYTNQFSRAQAAELIARVMGLDANILQPPVYEGSGGYEPGTVYLGYIQEGDTVDVYLVADANIVDYSSGNVAFEISDNTVSDFRDNHYNHQRNGNMVTILAGVALNPGETLRVGTVYLDNSSTATITLQ